MSVTMGRDKPHGQFGLEFDCVCSNSSQGPCFVSAILGCFTADIDGKAEIKCIARRQLKMGIRRGGRGSGIRFPVGPGCRDVPALLANLAG